MMDAMIEHPERDPAFSIYVDVLVGSIPKADLLHTKLSILRRYPNITGTDHLDGSSEANTMNRWFIISLWKNIKT
jgi:hypothetical protein